MACNMGKVATVEAWLDSGNHPDDATTFGGTLLVAAAERGGPDMMRMLIARGATVDARDDDEDRRGPLLSAAFEDNVRAMKILIESGANVNGVQRAPLTRTGPSIACGRGICRDRTAGGILMRVPPA